MHLFKRCDCRSACQHPFWYKFQFNRRRYCASTRTATKALAERIAKRQRERVVATHFEVAL